MAVKVAMAGNIIFFIVVKVKKAALCNLFYSLKSKISYLIIF